MKEKVVKRGPGGRFLPGTKGGPGKPAFGSRAAPATERKERAAVRTSEVFLSCGKTVSEVQSLVVKHLIDRAEKGVTQAVVELRKLVFPEGRVTPGVIRGRTVAARAQSVIRAVNRGKLSPLEAAQLSKGPMEHAAEAGEYAELRARLEEYEAQQATRSIAPPTVRYIDLEATPVEPSEVTPKTPDADDDR